MRDMNTKQTGLAKNSRSGAATSELYDMKLIETARDPRQLALEGNLKILRRRLLETDGAEFASNLVEGVKDFSRKKYLQVVSRQLEKEDEDGTHLVLVPVEFTPEKTDFVRNNDGSIKSVLENYCRVLDTDPWFSCKLTSNALDGRVWLSGARWDMVPHPIRDVDLFEIRKRISSEYGISNLNDIRQAVALTANKQTKHPVKELLEELEWDGVSRISDLFPRFLGAERSDYITAVTKLLLYGAIQRVFNPGVKFDICVILSDARQGTGKSSFCRFLALNDEWFCDTLADLGDSKRAYESLRGHWICELGEMLATQRTKDIEAIKAFLSRTADDYRDPYGIYPERRPRQCIFIGTSNKLQFLPNDRTGNRRFIPVPCNGDKAEVHPLTDERATRQYIQQCYAEAMKLGKEEGWPLVLDHRFDEQLNALRDDSTPEDSKVGIIQAWLDSTPVDVVCSRQVWEGAFPNAHEATRFELQEVADILNLQVRGWVQYRSTGGSCKRRVGKYGVQRAWVRSVAEDVAKGVAGIDTSVDGFTDLGPQIELPF